MDIMKGTVLVYLYCLILFKTLDAFERPGPTTVPSQPDSTYFLSILNGYRQLAREGKIPDQPRAIALPDLAWSSELMNKAKSRAENCLYQYERPQTTGEIYVYSISATEEPLHTAFDRYKEFEYGKVVYGLGHHLHYTQIVWQNSTSVGCWKHLCNGLKTAWKTLDNTHFTVCKFSPLGNVIGEVPYIYVLPVVTANPSSSYTKTQPQRTPTKWEIPAEPDAPFERPGNMNKPLLATATYQIQLHNGYRKLLREGKIPGQPRAAHIPDLTIRREHLSGVSGRSRECSIINLDGDTDYEEIAGYGNDPYTNPFHAFFDEYKNYTYGKLGQGWENNKRYTQMVWAKTVQLTCHTRLCYPFRTREGEYIDTAFYVCWYYPKGNILGEYPYPEFDEQSTSTYKPRWYWDSY